MGMPKEWTLVDRIRHGREFLVSISKVDLEYDPLAWHEHLKTTNAGGYRWSNKHLGMPREINEALADDRWQQAVAELKREHGA
jgi:hypothetical protein